MSLDDLDTTYGRVWRDFIGGINIFIGIGGDSHGRRLFLAIQSIFMAVASCFRIFRECFGISGGRAELYSGTQEFITLRRSICRIVVICIGGNDLDSCTRPVKSPRMIADDIINLFLELTCSGKVVYFVGLPRRYTHRHVTAEEYELIRSSVDTKLRRQLKSRYILLPAELLVQGAYRVEQRSYGRPSMQVHLTNPNYTLLANVVWDKILDDLQHQKSKPSTLAVIQRHLERD